MDRGNSGAVFRWRAGNLVCHAVERAAEDAGNPEADDIFLKRRDYIQPAPLAEALERVGKTGAGTSGDCLRPRQREFICRRESPFRRYGNAR